MIVALYAKNKVGFIDGSITEPKDSSHLTYSSWKKCNNMVLSWLKVEIEIMVPRLQPTMFPQLLRYRISSSWHCRIHWQFLEHSVFSSQKVDTIHVTPHDWIIDSGATEHMVYSTKFLATITSITRHCEITKWGNQ